MTTSERRLASRAAFLAGGLAAGLTLVYLEFIAGNSLAWNPESRSSPAG